MGTDRMGREALRLAMIALEHALEANTLDWQVRHAWEARRAYESARRGLQVHLATAHEVPDSDAREIAVRAVAILAEELNAFGADLRIVEARVAERLRQSYQDPEDDAPYQPLFARDTTPNPI
jgi:hypothetical protein